MHSCEILSDGDARRRRQAGAEIPQALRQRSRPSLALLDAGLYTGRRGACTAVVEATGGNYVVAQALLGHNSMTTTLNVDKQRITPKAFKDGMKVYGLATSKQEEN